MKGEKGFTLLEMLMVLTVWIVILLISIPLNNSAVEKKQEEQFIETLNMDLLFLQNLAMTTPSTEVNLLFFGNEYIIYKGSKPVKKRDFPSDWKVEDHLVRPLSFYSTGLIRRPGNMTIRMTHSKVKFIFPLGKGRGYIEKQ